MLLCLQAETSRRASLVAAGCPAVTVSYAELHDKSPKTQQAIMAQVRSEFAYVYVDSGASRLPIGDAEEAQAWWAGYLAFVLDNLDNADAFGELDVVDYDQVLQWRAEAHEAGWPVEKYVPVFHSSIYPESRKEMLKEWVSWCTLYPLVATGAEGLMGSRNKPTGLRPLIEAAREHGARVHGLQIPPALLRQAPVFWSVSSTTWTAGSKFGVIFEVLPSGTLKQHSASQSEGARVNARKRALALLGIEDEDIIQGYLEANRAIVDYVSARAWLQWGDGLTRRQRERGLAYWEEEPVEVVHPDEVCTCKNHEGKGCMRHGLTNNWTSGVKLNEYPRPNQAETSAKTRLIAMGNQRALVHGKRKRTYAPVALCDQCNLNVTCPRVQPGGLCAFDDEFNAIAEQLQTRDHESVIEALADKVRGDRVRLQRGRLGEVLGGNILDRNVTLLSAQLTRDLEALAKMVGLLKDGVHIDARRQSIVVRQVVEKLDEQSYVDALELFGEVRTKLPELLEAGEEE
jgi:hypothetical protein